MTQRVLRIAVIGGGIGGLTAALSLRQAGFEVDVYEQAPALTHIGGGINMGPNAARVLFRLACATGCCAKAYARSARISGAGMTAAPCSGRRSIRDASSSTAH